MCSSDLVTLVRYQINFGYLLLVYVFFLIALSAQYFINCFLVSLGDSIIVQLMLMVLGNIILSLFIIAPSAYLLAWTQSLSTSSLYLGIGPVATISSIYEFSNLVIGEALIYKDSSPYLIGSVMVNLLFAGGLAAFLFLRGDPSGERAGNWKPANKAIAIIPHVAALTLGLLISSLSLISTTALGVWSFSVYFTFFVGYYAFLSLLRKSFKPTKFDLITYICVVVAIITLSIIRSTTPPSLIYN